MDIGKRIKERREELGISADRLAAVIGKSRATVYRYENGDIEKMPVTVLEPIAKALNTTPAALMGWEEERERDVEIRTVAAHALRDLSDEEIRAIITLAKHVKAVK